MWRVLQEEEEKELRVERGTIANASETKKWRCKKCYDGVLGLRGSRSQRRVSCVGLSTPSAKVEFQSRFFFFNVEI